MANIHLFRRIKNSFQQNFLLERLFHLLGVFLGGFCDVDVGLHGFVLGMAGEFHHDLGRDADGEHEAEFRALRYLRFTGRILAFVKIFI